MDWKRMLIAINNDFKQSFTQYVENGKDYPAFINYLKGRMSMLDSIIEMEEMKNGRVD